METIEFIVAPTTSGDEFGQEPDAPYVAVEASRVDELRALAQELLDLASDRGIALEDVRLRLGGCDALSLDDALGMGAIEEGPCIVEVEGRVKESVEHYRHADRCLLVVGPGSNLWLHIWAKDGNMYEAELTETKKVVAGVGA